MRSSAAYGEPADDRECTGEFSLYSMCLSYTVLPHRWSPMVSPPTYQALKDIKLTTVRKAISADSYRRSAIQTFGWYAFDLALYLGLMYGVFAVHAWWAKLLFGLGAGCAVAFMFVWAHDAAHGALFESDCTAEVLGTLFMLPRSEEHTSELQSLRHL